MALSLPEEARKLLQIGHVLNSTGSMIVATSLLSYKYPEDKNLFRDSPNSSLSFVICKEFKLNEFDESPEYITYLNDEYEDEYANYGDCLLEDRVLRVIDYILEIRKQEN